MNWKQAYERNSGAFSFGTFYYKGLTIDGICSEWEDYFASQLQLPNDDLEFVSIRTQFQYYTYSTKANLTQSVSCSRKNVITSILKALSFGESYTENCDGNTWKVYR